MKKLLLSMAVILSIACFNAQTFTNMTSLLGSPAGGSPCVVDMNSDGLDDVVTFSGSNLKIDYQQPDGSFDEVTYDAGMQTSPSWSVAAGDIDGNGYNDLMLGGGSNVSFVYANNTGTGYSEVYIPEFIFSQRVNFCDIDNDGDLDAFACHDIDQSHPYRNDGNGNLVEDQSLLPTIDLPGNYATVFTDFDNDGDVDLYLTKCRGGSSTGAPERENALYENDGAGNFTETAAAHGLFDNNQSWVTIFEDFDNDGDLDSYTVNHTDQNFLKENDGTGMFTDITTGSGITANDLGSWACVGADFDNDGFVDILSESDVNDEYYHNNGDFTFTDMSTSSMTSSGATFNKGALGDLNNDGFIDVWTGGTLWMNDGNANNWFKVALTGDASNLNGIGARLGIYGDWGIQIRESRSGENFKPMSSLDVFFGLGTHSEIDSLIVRWPSGVVDVVENPAINTKFELTEGALVVPPILLNLNVILQGPYDSIAQLMNDDLRVNGQLPLVEPYTGFGYTHVDGGGETTTNEILEITGENAVVDWMIVEIRNGNGASQVLGTKSVLLKRNGEVMDAEGNDIITFNVASGNDFLVAVRHRNHLGIRNFVAMENQSGAIQNIDFTDTNTELYGTNSVNVIDGVNVMISGNANNDAQINSIDLNNFWRVENGQSYNYFMSKGDFNLDGATNVSDKNFFWRLNNAKTEQLD